MPNGFGSQPFGSSPYGLGTPTPAPETGGYILRDENTGDVHGSRAINPFTKDYELDDNGRVLGMSDLQQLVYLAVSTTKGSSAMRALGQEIRKIERITPNFLRRVDATLRSALQHLVNKRLIEVLEVSVDVLRPGVSLARLTWRDLSTGLEDTLSTEV